MSISQKSQFVSLELHFRLSNLAYLKSQAEKAHAVRNNPCWAAEIDRLSAEAFVVVLLIAALG